MMKKAISLFLAVFVLCCATSAMAIGTDTLGGNVRNDKSSMPSTDTLASMPCFRPGDTISFRVTGVTSGNELTLISYKQDASPSNSTVQYMNQYTLSLTTQNISYTIRDQASGVYMVKINETGGTVATFYYKVGNVTMSTVQKTGTTLSTGWGDPYIMHKYEDGKYSVAFIGKATLDSTKVNFGDVGATFEFLFQDTNSTPNINGKKSSEATTSSAVSGSALDTRFNTLISNAGVNLELNGSYSVLYGITLYDVPNGRQGNIKAKAIMN